MTKTKKALIALLTLSLLFCVFISFPYFSDLHDNLEPLKEVSNHTLLLASFILSVLLLFCGHWVRSIKNKILLKQIRPIRLREVFKGQMIGFLFNVLLPFRLGELVRAHYVGKGVLISRSAVFATIVFERFIDLLIVSLVGFICLMGIGGVSDNSFFARLIVSAFVICVLVGILLIVVFRQPRWYLRCVWYFSRMFNDRLRDKIRQIAWSFSYGLRNTVNKNTIKPYMAYSLLMWVFYLTATGILIATLFSFSTFGDLLTSSVAPYYGTSTVNGPSYIGSFNDVFSNVTHTLLTPTSLLTAGGFLLWLSLVVPSSIAGIFFLLKKQPVRSAEHSSTTELMKNKLYRDIDISQEFGHFLDAYFEGAVLNRILNEQELVKNFTVIKTFKGGSNALTLLAWQDEQMIVKKITLSQFADKLSSQYDWLAERVTLKHIAKALRQTKTDDYYTIDIEYKEEFIPFFDVIHATSATESWKVVEKVFRFTQKHIYHIQKIDDQEEKLNKYIDEKVVGKVVDAASTNIPISQLLSFETIEVNGRRLNNFNNVLKNIRKNKRAMHDLRDFGESPIHGDLTIDNIISNPATLNFLLLDPNNENAISDPVVDYGKMFQSLHSGYEFLVLLQSISVANNQVRFEEKKSVQYDKLYENLNAYLAKTLPDSKYKSILFHEAVHYCRMLTYRTSINHDTAAAFYSIAVRLFNDFLKQYE